MSQVTQEVINDINARELKGLETYGTTMDRNDLTQDQWLNHAYEEALDFAIYLKKLLIIRNGIRL
jgi:hypothetical protein